MKRILKKMMIGILVVAVALAAGGWMFLQQEKFGSIPIGKQLERIQKSPHYKEGKFENIEHTPDLTEGASYFAVTKEFLFNKSPRSTPTVSLPTKHVDLRLLSEEKEVLIWFGHSSYFIQVDGRRILVDPVLSGSASPVRFTTLSYKGSDAYLADDFPEIDYLFITHDHWDHLDHDTMTKLKPKVKRVITGLGVGAHLERWGYDPAIISETDWDEKTVLEEGFVATTTTARHFSGRGLARNRSLWAAYVVETPSMKFYFGGDSGYGTHFKEIGEKHGPFDLVLLECGQYDKSWKYIHMMPEEVVQAAEDLKAKKLMPVHWSKFTLGNHAWDEPIVRVHQEALQKNMPLLHPYIGEEIGLRDSVKCIKWWESCN